MIQRPLDELFQEGGMDRFLSMARPRSASEKRLSIQCTVSVPNAPPILGFSLVQSRGGCQPARTQRGRAAERFLTTESTEQHGKEIRMCFHILCPSRGQLPPVGWGRSVVITCLYNRRAAQRDWTLVDQKARTRRASGSSARCRAATVARPTGVWPMILSPSADQRKCSDQS